MRICIITDIYPSRGNLQGIFIHELCRQLVDLNCQVHVVTSTRNSRSSLKIIEGVHIHNLNSFHSFLPFFVQKVIKTVKKYQIDVLHAHFTLPGGLIGAITRKITSKPLVVTVHGYDITCIRNIGYGLICNPFLRNIVKKTLKSVDKVIAVSKSVKKMIIQLRIRDSKIKVIYNGIDLKRFCQSREILERSNILKYKKNWTNKRILLNVGSLVPVKGQKYLIEAMRDVIKEFPNSMLLICGDGPLKKPLHELVKRFDLQDYVKFMGEIRREDMPLYYAIADVFLLSSLIEGQSISLLEAMAFSKPIIASEVGGIPEIITTGRTGLLIEKQSPKKLAQAICMVLRDKKFAELMGRNARELIKNFSLDIQAKQVLSIYEDVKGAYSGLEASFVS